jgi:hypothetical protein
MAKVYATQEQIADYMGIEVSALPSDVATLMERAIDVIDYVTLNKIPDYYLDSDDAFTDDDIEDATEKAMGAMIQYWVEVDSSLDIIGQVQSFSIGKFSMTFKDGKMPVLAPRAHRHLMLAGLMFRGVDRL